jgi:hypothetical protein
MLEWVVEAVVWVFGWLVGGFLHLTGECLRWCCTLGRRRVRWWDMDDANLAWPSLLLGLAFWMAVGALLWLALR